MDITRSPEVNHRRKRRRTLAAVSVAAVVLAGAIGISRVKAAAPSVPRASVWIDTVTRGALVREVRGDGALVPEEIRWVAAQSDGSVEQIFVRPGTPVTPSTVIAALANPDIRQSALDAEFQLKAAESELNAERYQLEQTAEAAKAESAYNVANVRSQSDARLFAAGLLPEITRKVSETDARQMEVQSAIEKHRLQNSRREIAARLAMQEAKVDQLRTQYEMQKARLSALEIRASAGGVLQELAVDGQPLQIGQRVHAGSTIAKVARPDRLKAELKIAEGPARDVHVGQTVAIDTHNGIVAGSVTRVDPAVQNGTVTIDAAVRGPLPEGSRLDLSVDGTIELERLPNVLHVGRAALAEERRTVSLFRVDGGGNLTRVSVKIGRASANAVEIVEGLREGDHVVLSDMSRWDGYDRLVLR
jgi:HlyD family secretion protein